MKPVIFSLLDTPAFGGAEQYMFQTLSFLNEQGYPIVLGTNNQHVAAEFKKRVQLNSAATFTIIHAPYRLDLIGNWKGFLKYFVGAPIGIAWLIWTLWHLQRKHGKIICLLPGFTDRLTFSPFIKLFSLPLIWIEFGPLEPVFSRNFGVPRVVYHFSRKFADSFITISEWTKKSMVTTGNIPAEKIEIIYPGVHIVESTEIAKLQSKGRHILKKIGWENHFVISYVGRLASENQVELVIKAVALLSKTQNVHLLIIGDGPEREMYQKLVTKLQLQNRVHFTGFIDETEKFALLAASDIFTYTRTWPLDGFGITSTEAMSLGVPVITPDYGPQKEIIVDGESGLHFQPNSVQDLQTKIRLLIVKQTLRKKIGQNGKERVKKFTNKIQESKLLSIIQNGY